MLAEKIYQYFNVRQLRQFLKDVKMTPIDPITAIFTFLSTPVGQKLIDPLVTLENNAVSDFSKILQDLVVQVHTKLTATPVVQSK